MMSLSPSLSSRARLCITPDSFWFRCFAARCGNIIFAHVISIDEVMYILKRQDLIASRLPVN